MFVVLIIIVLASCAVGAIVYFGKSASVTHDEEHIIDDFHLLREGILKLHKAEPSLNYEVEDVGKYLPKSSKVDLTKYEITEDKKFIIVRELKTTEEGQKLVNDIGGESYMEKGVVYLCIHCHKGAGTGSGVAKISVSPKEHITTTTPVQFDASGSKVEDGRIIEEEWKGKEIVYRKAGNYTIQLRVKDKNGDWSGWAMMDIKVVEEKGIKGIKAGGSSVFAIFKNGEVEAYGENTHGQLGNSTTMPNKEFQPIIGHDGCFQIATGDMHTLFVNLMRGGKASGRNSLGQLGVGSRVDAKIFQDIWGLEKIKEVACGNGFSAALTYDGEVYTWGSNDFQQLGHSVNQKFVEMPTKINGISPVKQISLGSAHVLCLQHDGTVIGWGNNTHGELGLGLKGKSSEIGLSTLKNIKQVCASNGYSFAITNSGKVRGFGNNKQNQLGIIGEKEVLFPEEILQLKSIVKIVSVRQFTVALDEIGQVYAWGQFDDLDNDYPVKPTLVAKIKYAKDIAATNSKGYILSKDDEILEFGTDLKNVKTVRKSGQPVVAH